MINLLTVTVAIGISCPATVIDNRTNEWNRQDQQTLDNAKKHCGELYPDAPCLKMFRKKDSTTYNAVCGEENK
jgi:hypothetical protein